jgi:protein-S-isoprenylcysteine O-methyltransferase Ste14
MFLILSPREEARLAVDFADEWSAYARRTKRLLPGLY